MDAEAAAVLVVILLIQLRDEVVVMLAFWPFQPLVDAGVVSTDSWRVVSKVVLVAVIIGAFG